MQILVGPLLKSGSKMLWYNAVKALLMDQWFKRNQQFSIVKQHIGRIVSRQQGLMPPHGVPSPNTLKITECKS